MSQDPRLSILNSLLKFESQIGSSTNRQQIHQEMNALAKSIEGVADPVLRTEYERRLAVLRGSDGKAA